MNACLLYVKRQDDLKQEVKKKIKQNRGTENEQKDSDFTRTRFNFHVFISCLEPPVN